MTDNTPAQLAGLVHTDDALVPDNIGHVHNSNRLNIDVLTRRVHEIMTHSDSDRRIFGICSIPDVLLWDMSTNASGVCLPRGPQHLYHPNLSHPVMFWLPGVLKDVNLRNPDDDELPTICISSALFGKDSAAEVRALLGNNGAHPVHTCRGTPLIGAWHHQHLQAVGDSGYEMCHALSFHPSVPYF
ncbi:hypothetical protein EWM64_g331 [Hericium alpestre]|uniref:Uncharacterized protein n=1 Tax=Hericium alpestre TaxID=135208 RepID=A0A4Z0ACZ1_9AGAM|nr:hypothetical protein EWM64_g331 [Hericium alpestre]